jgi:hypothetical protein
MNGMRATCLVVALCASAVAGAPAHAELPAAFHAGSVLRLVALHPAQVETGLRDTDVFYGLSAGYEPGGRLGLAAEVATGAARAHFGIEGVPDPAARIWQATGAARFRPSPAWPFYVVGGGGLWHLDYAAASVLLAFPGMDPVRVELAAVSAPLLLGEAGVTLSPWPWLRLGAEGGVLGLRLNETHLDGTALTVAPHWRASPTAAVHLGLRF